MMWALLDFDGQPIRYYNYPARDAVEIKEPKLTYDEMVDQLGECLL